jgi:hypothetical protein
MTTPGKPARTQVAFLVLAGALVAVCGTFWLSRPSGRQGDPTQTTPRRTEPSVTMDPAGTNRLPAPSVSAAVTDTQRNLSTSRDAAANQRQLDELRRVLATAPPASASAALREFLEAKADAPTGLAFKVGADGFLTDHPTLRVFLLDQLAQIDPAGAAAYAKAILQSSGSPDEWAVALRTVAKADASPEGHEFLSERLHALLTHEAWVREPSVGFLEAFDVAVHLGGTKLVPTLAALVRKTDNQAAAHAAYLALDRLTIADAAGTLSLLAGQPELMQGREATRANYFARADARDANQRQIIESYLLNSAVGEAELEKFAGLYPSANYMVSHNLLTRSVTPDRAWLTARDAEALRHVRQLQEDARFARLKPRLAAIQRRLETFVQQAARPAE